MRIDRCLCFDVTFETLKEISAATGATTVEELQSYRHFGHRCQLCRPYVRRMLRTGRVVFGRVVTDSEEPERTPPPSRK